MAEWQKGHQEKMTRLSQLGFSIRERKKAEHLIA